MIIQVFSIPWFFHAWNFFGDFSGIHDFQSLWEPCIKVSMVKLEGFQLLKGERNIEIKWIWYTSH